MSVKENSLYFLMGTLGIGSILLIILMGTIAPLSNTIKPGPTSFISILLMVVLIPVGIFLVYYVDTLISGQGTTVSGKIVHIDLNTMVKDATAPLQLIIGIMFLIILTIILFCLTVHPVERFENSPFITRLDALEARTCVLIKRADEIIESEIRSKNIDGPKDEEGNVIYTTELQDQVRAAQETAHGTNFVNCNPNAQTSKSRIDKIEDLLMNCKSEPGQPLNCTKVKTPEEIIADRISALEATLRAFTGPTIISAFNSFVNSSMYVDTSKGCPAKPIPCYDFAAITPQQKLAILSGQNILDVDSILWLGKEDISTQDKKLDFLESVLQCHEQKLIKSIDMIVEQMKKGQITECQRKIMSIPNTT